MKSHTIDHFTYEWVMSRIKESCNVSMSHVPDERVMSHIYDESFQIWRSPDMYEWVRSHMNESWCIYTSQITYERGKARHMGWLRSVVSIKLWVSFAEYSLFYRVILQETYGLIDPTNRSHPIASMNESGHMYRSHVTNEWVMSYTNEARHM